MATKGRVKRIARQNVEVINDWGLHARPAAVVAQAAQAFASNLTIRNGDLSAPALSVASLLMLAAVKGSILEIEAEGPDAHEAVAALVGKFGTGFGEDHVVLTGQGTNCGIVIGEAHVLLREPDNITHYSITHANVANERKRLAAAIAAEKKECQGMITGNTTQIVRDFSNLLLAMLGDPHMSKLPSQYIEKKLVNAEWALKMCVADILVNFTKHDDPVWQSRADDYTQVMLRLVARMAVSKLRKSKKTRQNSRQIIVTGDVGIAEIIEYFRAGYGGLASSSGSSNSHAAILARGLNFPTIFALGHQTLEQVTEDTTLVLDSTTSELHIKPGSQSLQKLRKLTKSNKNVVKNKKMRVGNPPRTISRDGIRIRLLANIDVLDELEFALLAGAEGIGLFRTEFMYLNNDTPPGEEEQFNFYRKVIEKNRGLPITFRTLDIGHDKINGTVASAATSSPLGLRAIRYCLHEPIMFKNQLRALLRAANYGPMKIMFPMIGHIHEFANSLQLLDEAKAELNENIVYEPEIGTMIELPGTVFIMKGLAANCDFFSIGTNDLIQYTLAVDRNLSAVTDLADPRHPGVMFLLNLIISQAKQLNKPVTLCGEIATDISMVRLFCALGLREFSMNFNKIEEVRQAIGSFNIMRNAKEATDAVNSSSSGRIKELLEQFAP